MNNAHKMKTHGTKKKQPRHTQQTMGACIIMEKKHEETQEEQTEKTVKT
jgi:hypothetical protein